MEVIHSDDLVDHNVPEHKSDPVSINLVNDTPPGSPVNNKKNDNSSDIDYNEELIYRRLEAEISSVRSEVREKENEFQLLMKSIEKMGFQQKHEEHPDPKNNNLNKSYDEVYTIEDIENMQALISEMQATIEHANIEKDNHLKTIAQLENENIRLKEENMRLLQLSPKTICFAPHDRNDKLSEEDILGGSYLQDNHNLQKSGSDTRDPVDLFNSKTEAIKEKLQHEQNRNRELEFIVIAQKSTIENQGILLAKAEEDKKSIEKSSEKNRQALFKLNEKFLKTKSKIDNLLIYCKLMENCTYSKQEFMTKLAEIPPTIIAYIKGESDDFSLSKTKLIQSKLYKQALEHSHSSNRTSPTKPRRDLEIMIPEIKERELMKEQESSIITMSPDKSTKAGVTTNTHSGASSPLVKRTDSTNEHNILSRKDSLNASMTKRDSVKGNTSFISQAVRHSSSLIWNLKNQTTRSSIDPM